MRPRTLMLVLMSILGLLVALGLQGCLFGGGGGDESAEGGGPPPEAGPMPEGGPPPEGMPGEMAEPMPPGEMGEPTPPGAEMGGPPGEPGMEMPGAEMGAPAPGADASALVSEGTQAKRVGNYTEARSKFEAAVAADPSNLDAHWGLAWICAEIGDTAKAVEEFNTVLQLGATGDMAAEAEAALDRLQ